MTSGRDSSKSSGGSPCTSPRTYSLRARSGTDWPSFRVRYLPARTWPAAATAGPREPAPQRRSAPATARSRLCSLPLLTSGDKPVAFQLRYRRCESLSRHGPSLDKAAIGRDTGQPIKEPGSYAPVPFRLVRQGSQILSRRFRVGVVGAQRLLAGGERPLQQPDRDLRVLGRSVPRTRSQAASAPYTAGSPRPFAPYRHWMSRVMCVAGGASVFLV